MMFQSERCHSNILQIMLDSPEEVSIILSAKLALKYSGLDLDAMRAVAEAAKKRSLADFNAVCLIFNNFIFVFMSYTMFKLLFQAFGSFRDELQCDAVVKKHFNSLSDSMLEKDLCRIIEPYSYVQLEHIASKIGLTRDKVEKKLSQMILDRKFSGNHINIFHESKFSASILICV